MFLNWEATTNVTLQSDDGRCASVRGVDGTWQAHDCPETFPYICEKPAGGTSWWGETRAEHISGLHLPLHVYPLRQDTLGVDVIGNGTYALMHAVQWSPLANDSSAVASLIEASESYINITLASPLTPDADFSLAANFRVFSFEEVSVFSFQQDLSSAPTFAVDVITNNSQPWVSVVVSDQLFGAPVDLTAGWYRVFVYMCFEVRCRTTI